MHKYVIDKAVELATEHSDRIKEIVAKLGGAERSYVKLAMTSPEALDKELLKHIYYRDAYARLVNSINFTEIDKNSWRPKDYIDAFLPSLYRWAETEGAKAILTVFLDDAAYMIEEKQRVNPERLIYEAALAQAVLKEVFYSDDRQEGRSTTESGGGSSEPETDG